MININILNMEKSDFFDYESPLVEILEVEVEKGFAASGPDLGGGGEGMIPS